MNNGTIEMYLLLSKSIHIWMDGWTERVPAPARHSIPFHSITDAYSTRQIVCIILKWVPGRHAHATYPFTIWVNVVRN